MKCTSNSLSSFPISATNYQLRKPKTLFLIYQLLHKCLKLLIIIVFYFSFPLNALIIFIFLYIIHVSSSQLGLIVAIYWVLIDALILHFLTINKLVDNKERKLISILLTPLILHFLTINKLIFRSKLTVYNNCRPKSFHSVSLRSIHLKLEKTSGNRRTRNSSHKNVKKNFKKINNFQLETSSKSLYLLTLFLNTGLVIVVLFDISSDLVLLSLSSKAPLVIILFLVDGVANKDGDDGGEDLTSSELCFFNGFFFSWTWRPFPFSPFIILLFFPSSWTLPLFLREDEEEFDEFDDFSFESSFWLKHQLQIL